MVVKKVSVERNPSKRTIIGVDSSSTGIAYTVLKDGELVDQGKIKLDKFKTMQSKLEEIHAQWTMKLDQHEPDHVFIEKSIFVKNPATARTLSYIVGSLMCLSVGRGYETTDVEPSTWKAFFGYRNVTTKFQNEVKAVLGNTEGKKFCDRMRKSQTWRVIAHNFDTGAGSLAANDHDMADSWGIALWGIDNYVRPVQLEITDAVRYDLAELERLGVSPK